MLPPRVTDHFRVAYLGSLGPPTWSTHPVGTSLKALVETLCPKEAIVRVFVGLRFTEDLDELPGEEDIVVLRIVPSIPIWLLWVFLIISILATIASLVVSLTQKQAQPDSQSRFDSPTLRGARNRVALHDPIPKIYGRYRTKPPLGAYTYTEIVGTDQFLRCLFVVGYGPLVMDIADMKIGETAITEFQDIEIEVRPGELTDPPVTLYPSQVTQEDLNVTLSDQKMAPEDVVPGEVPGSTGWQQRASDLSTDEIGIELSLPGGIGNITGKGQNQKREVVHVIEYRKMGDTVWIRPPAASLRVSGFASTRNDGEIVIKGFRLGFIVVGANFVTPSRDQYEIRMKCVECQGLDADGHNQFYHETHWVAIKSFRNEAPWNKPGIAMIALRIRASEQLQGTIDDFTVIARSKLPTWNGTAWTAPIETRNPAWIFADILRGPANPAPVPDEVIDANRLLEWANLCETHTTPDATGTPVLNPMYYDAVVDYRGTVYRLLADVAAVARASPHQRDGIYSVVFDHDRSAEPPVQMITPNNVISGSFSARKMFIEEAHAYRVSFNNEAKDWGEDEVVLFTPGYTATTARIYEKIQWTGITNPDRAVDETRFMVFERRYRPEVFSFDMDLENLVFERGEVVVFAHDVPMLGLAYGRISELIGSVTGFKLDEKVVFEPSVNYGVRIRRHHSVLDVLDSLPVVNPATAGVDVETNTLTLVTPLSANKPEVGDLVSFGELGIETRRCIVRSISPKSELIATVELIDEAPQIFQDLTQPIPDYDPGINRPRDLPPFPPEIISVTAPDHSNLVVTFRLFSGFGRGVARCEIQVRVSPDGPWQDVPPVAPAGMIVAVIPGLALDVWYDVRVRAVSPTNIYSTWTETTEPFFHSSHPVDISRYLISDLRLENILTDPNQFVGPSPIFRWQISILDGTEIGDPVSDAPRQATIVRESEIDRFDGYTVRVLEAVWDDDLGQYTPGPMIDEDIIQDHRFTYSYDHNVDDGGPRRVIFFEVAAQIDGLLTESKLQLASNPSPEIPELRSLSGANGTWIELDIATASADADWDGILVWMSENATAQPSDTTLIFKGRLDRVLRIPSKTSTTYYLYYASFDRFSTDPATLNVSPQQTLTTGAIPGATLEEVFILTTRGTPIDMAWYCTVSGTTPSLPIPPWFRDLDGGSGSHGTNVILRPHDGRQFIATNDGVLHISYDTLEAVHNTISNDLDMCKYNFNEIIITYSIGASPAAPASQLYLFHDTIGNASAPDLAPGGNGQYTGVPMSDPPLPTAPQSYHTFRWEASLDVYAGNTYWFYVWASYKRSTSNQPLYMGFYYNALSLSQIISE